MSDSNSLLQQLEHERQARAQAEALLESRSRELQAANEELQALTAKCHQQAELTSAIRNAASAEAIITFAETGRIESFNPAAERIFGYTCQEAQELRIADLISEEFDGRLRDRRGLHNEDEQLGVRRDRSVFPMLWSVSEVRLDDRRMFTAIARDLTSRRALELQLAHAQKMESVGQLAAGIAHEINTPIQYIGDNVRFLASAFQDLDMLLRGHIALANKAADEATLIADITALSELASQINLTFLREEIPAAVSQSIEGADRVGTIVRAMKEFSQPVTEEKSLIDVHHAIVNTITISRNEWKDIAEVETQFDPAVPLVLCFPNEFNQTILNLVVNAAHAIGDIVTVSGGKGRIGITTRKIEDSLEVRISDTGTGIPVEIQPRIFDPFFTTKPVGKGTGQGLAIVYSAIVEKHRGTIEFETAPGVGTTFILRMPLRDVRYTGQRVFPSRGESAGNLDVTTLALTMKAR